MFVEALARLNHLLKVLFRPIFYAFEIFDLVLWGAWMAEY